MPTRKIADLPEKGCTHREHFPPQWQVFEDGIYEHTCPGCGHVTTFTVPQWRVDSSLLRERINPSYPRNQTLR